MLNVTLIRRETARDRTSHVHTRRKYEEPPTEPRTKPQKQTQIICPAITSQRGSGPDEFGGDHAA